MALDGQVWGLLDRATDVSQPDEKLLLRPWWWSLVSVQLDCREPQTQLSTLLFKVVVVHLQVHFTFVSESQSEWGKSK